MARHEAPPPAATDSASGAQVARRGRGAATLGPVLAWAIAFADLGTSIYYVPGILSGQVGRVATAFVLVTTVAFVFLAFEHLEVAHRYPAGGGGLSAAVEAFGARVGVVSGALMVSAYLVAIALTVVTAIRYLSTILPPWPHQVLTLSAVAILALGLASLVGVRAFARWALVASLVAFATHVALLIAVINHLRMADWAAMLSDTRQLARLRWTDLATGFAAAWLAYSGLESLGQLAPALREPRRRTIRIATALLVGSVLVTVPVLTAVAVESAQRNGLATREALLAWVAYHYGGPNLKIPVVVAAAALLILAAHVAFSGCFSVFLTIGEHGYLPAAIAKSETPEHRPRGAVIVVSLAALVLVLLSHGHPSPLGRLFVFGLLGSYTITSISLNVLRWRGRRWGALAIGILVSLALAIPWATSWFSNLRSTAYGATATGLLLMVALVTHRGWIRSGKFGFLTAAAAEESAAELSTAVDVLTLQEALELKPTYPSTTMIALRAANPNLCLEAARRARGVGDAAVYVVFVEEVPGFLFPSRHSPSKEARIVLQSAVLAVRTVGMDVVPIWRLSHDAGASLAEAAEDLNMGCVFMGSASRGSVWRLLQGDVLKRLLSELPERIRVVICQ